MLQLSLLVCCFLFLEEDEEGPEFLIQELLLGETAEVQEPGELQFTFAPAWVDGGDRTWPLIFEYGLGGGWEVGLALPYEDEKGTSGSDRSGRWGAAEAEVGYAVNTGGPWLLKLELGAGYPLEEEEEDESWSWETGFSLSRIMDWGALHAGAGTEEEVDEGERETEVNLGLVLPFGSWRGLLETQYVWEEGEDDSSQLAPGLAFTYGEMELVLGVVLGLEDQDEDRIWRLSLTYEWD